MKTSQYKIAVTHQITAVCLPAQDQNSQKSSMDQELLVINTSEGRRITLVWGCLTGRWLMSQWVATHTCRCTALIGLCALLITK